MMNDAEYKYLHGLIEAMAKKQFLPADMDWVDKTLFEAELSAKANNLEIQFLKDWKKSQDKETTKKEREKIEKNLENLAKALPNVTKGTLSAITAFKNGDAISGSAAIMDICAFQIDGEIEPALFSPRRIGVPTGLAGGLAGSPSASAVARGLPGSIPHTV